MSRRVYMACDGSIRYPEWDSPLKYVDYVDYTKSYGNKPFEGSITAVADISESFIKSILHRNHIIRIVVNKKKRATTVFWTDGTVTVVKRAKGDRDDLYHAVASAFAIKNFGSNSAFKKEIENAVEYLEK